MLRSNYNLENIEHRTRNIECRSLKTNKSRNKNLVLDASELRYLSADRQVGHSLFDIGYLKISFLAFNSAVPTPPKAVDF
jgi:hypothetical protein